MLLQFMLDVARYLVYETTVFLMNHYGVSFVEFLSGLLLDPDTFVLSFLGMSVLATLVTSHI